jgi:hypothetical protein
VSLTGHLKRSTSPVRGWFEQRFPETSDVARSANRKLRNGVSAPLIPCPAGADASLAGTALDYLLRACLQVTSIEQTSATKAAQALSRQPAIGARAIDVEREAVDLIKQLDPGRRDLTDTEWRELCTGCLVLARFEQSFRSIGPTPAIQAYLVDPLRRVSGLDDFVPLALTEGAISDLEILDWATWEDRRSWRDEQPLVLNPKFEQTSALGGADGDLIVSGRLVDLKATATAKIVSRRDLWQLLGYAFPDTNDAHGIRKVSIAAPRWRSIISWPLEDLMRRLSPVAPISIGATGTAPSSAPQPPAIEEAHSDFARLLSRIRPRRRMTVKGMPPRPTSTRSDSG